MDALLNGKKEDRVVITNLRTEETKPDGHVEARQWLNGLIGAALDSLIPEASSKIKFINDFIFTNFGTCNHRGFVLSY